VDADTIQVDTTGIGLINAAIWVTSKPDSSQITPGVDNVFIDGQENRLRGLTISLPNFPINYGVYFQNDMRKLPQQDTTFADTLVNYNISNFKRGVAFRSIADGMIAGCNIDSVDKGIELASNALNVRNLIKDNVITNVYDRGINVRGSENIIEDNSVLSEVLKYGIYIDKNYSNGNVIRNNVVEGGDLARNNAGLMFKSSIGNVAEGNTVSNIVKSDASASGIRLEGGAKFNQFIDNEIMDSDYGISFLSADSNTVASTTITGNSIGIQAVQQSITADPSKDNLIVDSQISNSDSLDVLVSGGSSLLISNSTLDTSKVSVEGELSYLGVGWHLNVTVTDGSSPIEGATVSVSSPLLQEVVREGVTNAEGKVFFNLAEYLMTAQGVIPTAQYSVEVVKDSFDVFTTDVILTDNMEVSAVVTGLEQQSESVLPKQFALNQNYPNPFNPETKIKYQLPKNSHVLLNIYNLLGQLVITLVDEKQAAGFKSVIWDGRNRLNNQVSTGLYIYVLKAGDFINSKRMVLLR
jgi:parallel beta-helix repeat protein